ncbi:MAG: phosphatase PAP2 family protein [Bacteroides sp.]|nr:phosphatase PAP2 family protein [Roseburia sp.]MCM1345629.1 phosphatase PAP2 family protein [Bacteroides sp.]MCM1420933.1 phosphatase PAP2 family protein [Bacteroides sp.]
MRYVHIIILYMYASVSVFANDTCTPHCDRDTLPANSTIHFQPVDSAYLKDVEALMIQKSKEMEAEKAVAEYEARLLQEEMTLHLEETQPLLRGIVLSIADNNFNKKSGFLTRVHHDKADYGVALAPLAANWILKVAGVESRSTTQRMLMANAMALALSSGISSGLKASVKETRPDGSDENSMPSGHTTLAFVGATILHREYGHHSPWISVGGYTAATATQLLRLRNSRHWINDTFIGAGIGVVSTNVAYFLTDAVLGERGINRPRMMKSDMMRVMRYNERPSSFSLVSGTEIGKRNVSPDAYELLSGFDGQMSVSMSSTFYAGFETSLFLNDKWAVEAMARVSNSRAKASLASLANETPTVGGCNINMYHTDMGLKYSLPVTLASRFSLRAFAGVRFLDEADMLDADTGQPFLHVPGNSRFEVGGGFAFDYLSTKKYAAGFSFDYVHTCSPLMRNRCYASSVWKIIL